ncbi:HutD family protein [Luteimonas sp. RD2P54]|uniref:HutD family protein n=1 Tax=Luteimonas endophytica TaxID=3042023 RepID=A0ABT6JB20_9GAMM|nr:HutD family protein [Luteimonas endophytica]MDH5824026.1 HutD family protein [Luteimonas endophytica]
MASVALPVQVIPANEYRRERWRNGAGWTRQIVAVPEDAEWLWRLSIAEVEQDSAFSRYPGVERVQVLLAGEGLRLRFDDGHRQLLAPPHGTARYCGERAVAGGPVEGLATVFNLMWRRDAVRAELWRRPLVGPMLFFADPGEQWALHLLGGQARFDRDAALPALAQGDTALLSAPRRRRFLLDGGGELLVIRLQELD